MRRRQWLGLLAASCVVGLAAPAAATCRDRVKDGIETDIDCGGDCPPCKLDRACQHARDCESGLCAGGRCAERRHEAGTEVPPGYSVERSETDGAAAIRRIGIVTLGMSYGASYIAALTLPGELSWLYVPVLGPYVLAFRDGQALPGLLALDAGLQTVGLALLVGGIVGGSDRLVRDQEGETYTAKVRVTPARVGERGYGVGVLGQW